MTTFQQGDIIDGKYEVLGQLGKGGMGFVLSARHLAVRDLVALKFLLPALRTNPVIADRFKREAITGNSLKSEHVVRVRDVGEFEGAPYIVMEHLDGEDLAARITRLGQLAIAQAVDIALQAGEAIAEAHTRGIVHRDLKPGNLFILTTPERDLFVKVLDFGIAKALLEEDMSVTESAAVLGSPRYMSPEQLGAPRMVDARTDVWALGIILYEMLAGVAAFQGDTFPVVCKAILDGDYPPLAELREDLPNALEDAISAALALKHDERLASVGAFATRLEPFASARGKESCAIIRSVTARASTPPPARAVVETAPQARLDTVDEPVVKKLEPPPPETEEAPKAPPRTRPAWLLPALAVLGVSAAIYGVQSAHGTRSPDAAPSASAIVPVASVPSVPVASASPSASAAPSSSTALAPVAAPSTVPDASTRPRATIAPPVAGDACAKGATAACEAACVAHRPGRCLALAKALDHGIGAPKNPARAADLYKVECDGGALDACNNLGALYAAGRGVPRNSATAVSLYDSACERGSGAGCANLGSMHFSGDGVAKDEKLGADYFHRACKAGIGDACVNLSGAYADGRGVPKDPAHAFELASQACSSNVARGCILVAEAQIAGNGAPKDVAGGLGLLKARCAAKDAAACRQLSTLYSAGRGVDVPIDAVRARDYANDGCKAGDAPSCGLANVFRGVDSTGTKSARASASYAASCDAGELFACVTLGDLLITGKGGTVDRPKGIALLQKACTGGEPRGCAKLAEVGGR